MSLAAAGSNLLPQMVRSSVLVKDKGAGFIGHEREGDSGWERITVMCQDLKGLIKVSSDFAVSLWDDCPERLLSYQ